MATNITTDNLLGQFCTLINTNAAGVADVDDLFIYKYAGGSLQRITARIMRDYFLAGLSSQMNGIASTLWVTEQLALKADAATVSNLTTMVNAAANGAATAQAAVTTLAGSFVYCTQAYYDGLEEPNENITYYIYEE